MDTGWYMYIAKCADGSLYTGISTNLERRIKEHNISDRLGAKSLRFRRPVTLAYYESFATRAEALSREIAIKRLTREDKSKLIEGFKLKRV